VRGHPGADRPRRPADLVGFASGPADEALRALANSHREPRRPGQERREGNDDAERGDDPDAVAQIADEYVEGSPSGVVVLRHAEICGSTERE